MKVEYFCVKCKKTYTETFNQRVKQLGYWIIQIKMRCPKGHINKVSPTEE